MSSVNASYRCPLCGGQMRVADMRLTAGRLIRRRRRCMSCEHRVTTYEVVIDGQKATALVPVGQVLVVHDMARTPHGTWELSPRRSDDEVCGYCFNFGGGRCPICPR